MVGQSTSGVKTLLTPFTKSNPCPVCGNDGCAATDDGLFLCLRRRGWVDGWYFLGEDRSGLNGLYRRESDDGSFQGPPSREDREQAARRRAEADAAKQAEFERYAATAPFKPMSTCARERTGPRGDSSPAKELARRLGLPEVEAARAFARMGVLWNGAAKRGDWFAFPMVDGDGKEIGRSIRHPNEVKKTTGRNGLFIPTDIVNGRGPIYVVEGESDAAVVAAMGRLAVGRPSNTAGAEQLAAWIKTFLCRERWADLVVIGENDIKPDGRWPGRYGMYHVASKLAELLGVDVFTAMTPDGAKDARDWYKIKARSGKSAGTLGAEFADAIYGTRQRIKPGGELPDLMTLWRDGEPAAIAVENDLLPLVSVLQTPIASSATTPPNRPADQPASGGVQRGVHGRETPPFYDQLADLGNVDPKAGQHSLPDYWGSEREVAAAEVAAAQDATRRYGDYGDFADDADLMALLNSLQPAGEISECRRARVVLKEIADALSKRSVGNPCMSPSCVNCRPAVSRQTFFRFLHHVGHLPDGPVFISRVFVSDWRRSRLWEKAGRFGRVVEQFYGCGKNSDAKYLVLSTKPLPGSTPMDRKAALMIVAEAIRTYPGDASDFVFHHPFAFSRSWGAVEEEIDAEDAEGGKKKREKKWELDHKATAAVRKSNLTVDGLVSILQAYGVSVKEENFFHKAKERLYLDFRMPDDGELRAKIMLAIELNSVETANEVFAARQAVEDSRCRDDFSAAVFGHP